MSGSQHLARLSFDIISIKLMVRWDSNVVLRYIAEAPLGAVTETYRKLAAVRSLTTQLDDLLTEMSLLRGQVDATQAPAAAAQQEEVELAAPPPVPLPDDAFEGTFLVNAASGKYSLPFVNRSGDTIPNKAKCEWRFADIESSSVARMPKTDFTMICGVCLPKHRKASRLCVPVNVEPAVPGLSSISSDSSVSSA